MMYEIPREIFKQRLEDKLNFAFVDVNATPGIVFDGSVHLPFSSGFAQAFAAKYPSKTQNVILYATMSESELPAQAAQELTSAGYQFVYFYRGSEKDIVLDKGLN